MKLTLIVGVDYDELAEHLSTHYCQDDKDSPIPLMTAFSHFRGILDQHVEDLMDADSFAADTTLTDILLRRHTFGTVTEILVTRGPGHVTNKGTQSLVLPLILLEIDY